LQKIKENEPKVASSWYNIHTKLHKNPFSRPRRTSRVMTSHRIMGNDEIAEDHHPTSQVSAFIALLLPTAGNKNVRIWSSIL
jgi:hypothetical protein